VHYSLIFLILGGEVEFQQLRGFFYSARLGNLTKAAEKISVTQSAVSQQIKALEEEIGVKLFDRYGPRKNLTPDGNILYELVTPIIQEIDNLKNRFEERKGTETGNLIIAATTFMIMNQLPYVIKGFSEKYPHIHLTVLERRCQEIISLAQAGEIDVGIAPVTPIPANLNVIRLKPLERVLITAPDHPLAQKENVTLLDIAQYPMISYEKGLVSREECDTIFKDVKLEVEVVMEATNAETIKRYVELGVGIAIIPRLALFPQQHYQVHVIDDVSSSFGKIQYGIILRKGRHITQWAKSFLYLLNPAWEGAF